MPQRFAFLRRRTAPPATERLLDDLKKLERENGFKLETADPWYAPAQKEDFDRRAKERFGIIWREVCDKSLTGPFKKKLVCQGRREIVRLFGPAPRLSNPQKYRDELREFPLPDIARESMLAELINFECPFALKSDPTTIENWFDINYPSHYYILAEYLSAHPYSYTPGYSRNDPELFRVPSAEGVLLDAAPSAERVLQDAASPCVSYSVMSHAKDRDKLLHPSSIGKWRNKYRRSIEWYRKQMTALERNTADDIVRAHRIKEHLETEPELASWILDLIVGRIGRLAAKAEPYLSYYWLMRFPGKGTGHGKLIDKMTDMLR